jgi:anti-sigma regulatory factor (Ser/Thr protein kinase)
MQGTGPERRRYCPYQSDLVLAAFPSAVPCARKHAELVVWEWGLAALAEKVGLVVSELVTNAVNASERLADGEHGLPTIQLWLSADDERVRVQVWDASEELPKRQIPEADAEHGRGLLIVDAICEARGEFRLEGGNGKIVWALVGPG